MKQKIFLLLTILLLTVALPMNLTAEDFVIEHYQVDMVVMENNVYHITEVINLNFTSRLHGINRKLPLYYEDRQVFVTDVRVRDYEFALDDSGDYLKIKIGSEDQYIEGPITYHISYNYDPGADEMPEMDEFYHNIIGTLWDTTIEEAAFSITMPKAFDGEYVNCTSGPEGSTKSQGVEWDVKGNTITGRTLKPLSNYEGLTVALPLPEGYWVGAKVHHQRGRNLFLILGYPLYAAAFILAILIWFIKGRNKKKPKPVLRNRPPEGFNPAELGYVLNGTVTAGDMTALIFHWSDRGYIEIEEQGDGGGAEWKDRLILTKIRELPDETEQYEKDFFDILFRQSDGRTVSSDDLSEGFEKELTEIRESLEKSLSGKRKRAIHKEANPLYTLTLFILAALPLFSSLIEGAVLLSGNWNTGLIIGFIFGMIIIVTGNMLAGVIASMGINGKIRSLIAYTIIVLFFTLLIGAFCIYGGGMSVYKYFGGIVCGLIILVLVRKMKRRTPFGQKVLEETLGFQMYIKAGKKKRDAPEDEADSSRFYHILPYAMVMGLTKKWAHHFKGITMEPPVWFTGRGGRSSGDSREISSNLDKDRGLMAEAMAPSTSSGSDSGSGGSSSGGFSGGGSGGGGGDGW